MKTYCKKNIISSTVASIPMSTVLEQFMPQQSKLQQAKQHYDKKKYTAVSK